MIQVTDKFYRGPRPQNGLLQIQSLGFGSIINLESDIYEICHDDVYQQEQPLDYGIRPFRYRLSDYTQPHPDVVRAVLRRIATENSHGFSVYMHCLHGVDRTGYCCAAYRMLYQGWSYGAAVKEMFDLGFHRFPYWWWVPSLKQYVRN